MSQVPTRQEMFPADLATPPNTWVSAKNGRQIVSWVVDAVEAALKEGGQ